MQNCVYAVSSCAEEDKQDDFSPRLTLGGANDLSEIAVYLQRSVDR